MQQEMQQIFAKFGAEASYIEPEVLKIGSGCDREGHRGGAAAGAVRVLPAGHHPSGGAHAVGFRGEDPGRRGAAGRPRRTTSTRSSRTPTSRIPRSRWRTARPSRSIRPATASCARRRIAPTGRRPCRPSSVPSVRSAARFGVTMNSNVQKSLFYARSRNYASNLEAALNGPNIPVSVYMRLVDGVNRHLPTFHRYLRLRKRMMGLTDDLHYYDLYAPLVASVDLRYTPEEAQEHVIGAMAPLGKDYTDVLRRGFKDRWIDWYPDRGQGVGRLLERRRVRRPPLHAAQLSRAVQRRQHAGPRARAHDAELLLEQDAAVRDGGLSRRSWRRSHRRSTRRCSSTTC